MTATPSSQALGGPATAALAARLAPIDTDRALAGITALATRILRAPIAIVSLFEGNDEVVLSGRGAALAAAGRRWPLADAMCREMATTQRRVVYGDARRDAALRERPAVATH